MLIVQDPSDDIAERIQTKITLRFSNILVLITNSEIPDELIELNNEIEESSDGEQRLHTENRIENIWDRDITFMNIPSSEMSFQHVMSSIISWVSSVVALEEKSVDNLIEEADSLLRGYNYEGAISQYDLVIGKQVL